MELGIALGQAQGWCHAGLPSCTPVVPVAWGSGERKAICLESHHPTHSSAPLPHPPRFCLSPSFCPYLVLSQQSCSLPGQILPPASLSHQRTAQPAACPAPGAVRALGTLLAPWQRAGLWGDEAPAHPAAAAACAQSTPCPSPPHARCSHVPAIRRLPSAHTPDRCWCQGPACSRCLGWHHCLGNSSATRTAQAGCAHGSERAALGSEESEITRQRRKREMLQEAPRHPGWSGFITKCSPI